MKSFSIVKLFTSVCFLVVTLFSNQGWSEDPTTPINSATNCSLYKDPAACEQTKSNIARTENREEAKELDSDCQKAYEEYEKVRGEAASACKNLTSQGTSGDGSEFSIDPRKKCADKLASCKSQIQGLAPSDDYETEDRSRFDTIFGVVKDYAYSQLPDQRLQTATTGCLTDFNSKDNSEAQKEFRERRSALEKEKKELEDEIAKEKEEQNKKQTEIQKDIQELERDTKEASRKLDSEMREKLTASSKASVEAAKRMRDLQRKITDASSEIRKAQFEHANEMLELTNDKINQQCQEFLETAKNCMIKSAKGATFGEKDVCTQFPKLQNRGTKATAELQKQLNFVNSKCYEQASTAKKKANFTQNEKMRKLNDAIQELNSQMNDEKQQTQIASNDAAKIQEEATRQKDETAADLAAQIQTLNNDLLLFITNSNEKMTRNNQRILELIQKLDALSVEERIGAKSATTLAEAAIETSEAKANDVRRSCGCEGASSKQSKRSSNYCARFAENNKFLEAPSKKKSGRSGTSN